MTSQSRKTVAIVTSGYLPVPNTRGGAVEALDMMLVEANESTEKLNLVVYSIWDEDAVKVASHFHQTRFEFVTVPNMVRQMDAFVYYIAKEVLKVRKHVSYRYILQRLWFIRAVSTSISREEHDALVIENHATLFGVLTRHGNSNRYAGRTFFHLHNEVTRDFGRAADITTVRKVLGVSEFINRTLMERYPEMTDGQFTVLRNAVDTKRFGVASTQRQGEVFRREWGVDEGDIVFLFSGRLTAEKGARELMEAYLAADIPASRLVIVGGYFFDTGLVSEFESALHSLADRSGDRIIFTGFLDYDSMPGVYAAADVCCLPSVWDDPAPLTIIEALAAGKPIISTDSGGIPEYIGSACAIALPRDRSLTVNLTHAMRWMAENRADRERMGAASAQRAREYGAREMFERFCEEIVSEV